MGLLHKDEPVPDARMSPDCNATDWVLRAPRLGGQARIVCRACGHDEVRHVTVVSAEPWVRHG